MSILLTLVMVFNVLVSGIGNNLSYADNNLAYNQNVSANKTLNGSEKTLKNNKNQIIQKSKNTGLDKKAVDKNLEDLKKKDLDKTSTDKKLEEPSKKDLDKKLEDPKKKDLDKKSVEGKLEDPKAKEEQKNKPLGKESTDRKIVDPKNNNSQDSEEKKLGKTGEKAKENQSLDQDKKQTSPETKEEKKEDVESEKISFLKQEKGLIIKVDAPKGAFPKGTTVSVRLVSKLKDKIAYDITFKDNNNKEVQPAKGTEVKVSFILDKTSSLLPDDMPVNLKLYHVVNGVPKVIDTKVTAKGFMEDKGIQSVTLSGKVSHFSEFRLVAEEDLDFDKIKDLAKNTKEVEGNVITEAWVTDTEGKPFNPGQQVGAWQGFRIYAKFKLPDNVVKEGDTTTMTLPIGIDTAPPDKFQVKDGDKVIANVVMYNQNPAKIVLTYTKYAEEHSGVQGSFYFNALVNAETQTGSGKLPVTLTVNGKVIPGGHVDYKPPHFINTQFSKSGWMTSDKTEGKYDIRINQDNVVLVNAKFEDTIQSENVSFIQDSLEIWQGKWDNKITSINLAGKKNVTQEFIAAGKVNFDGKKLTINIGSIGESNEKRGFQILYKVKLGYEPMAGEEIKNKASLTYGSEIFNKDGNYKIKDAGGTGEGYVFKIKIQKTGENNKPLAGAKFDVIRVRSNAKVGEITTGQGGIGEIGKLLRDEYRLVETEAPQGYQKLKDPITVNPADFDSNTKIAQKDIENKKEEKITVKVTKKWENQDGTPLMGDKPTISLQLLKDGQPEGTPVQLTNGNITHTWTNLDKTDEHGNDHKYSVQEVGEKDYKIQLDGNWYKVDYGADSQSGGLTVTNKKLKPWTPMIPPTRDLKVTKVWKDKDNNDLVGPVEKIEVELYKDGAATGTKLDLTKANNWTGEFKKLPVSATLGGPIHKYTVKETGESGNAIQFGGKWYGVTYGGTMADGLTVTNKEKTPWTPMIPPTRDLKVTKVWKDKDNNDLVGPVEKIEVELYKDGAATGTKLDLTKANNWTGEFKKLPVSATLGGPIHKYTVKETGESGNAIQFGGKWYGVTYGGTMADGLTVTNKEKTPWTPMIPPTRDLKVTKVWKDKDNNDLIAPVEKIEVELYKDGAATGTKLDLTKANNWTGEFKKLPVSATLDGPIHKYTVKETGESGNAIQFGGKWYGVTYGGTMADGLTVTNKEKTPWTPMIPPTRDLKVTKVWKDKDNNDLNAPVEKIEVELYKDGTPTGTKLDLTKANNWTGEFKKLPVSATLDGPIHKYTVKETGESGNAIQFVGKWYGVTYGGTMADGLTVTNKEKTPWTPMIPPTRNLKVTKVWKDKDNNDLVGPVEKIEVELYKDGVATGKKLDLTKANNWTGTFEKLDVADGLGSTNYYKYTVKEVGESGAVIQLLGKWYGVTYGGTMKDGLTVTNKEKRPWTPMEPPFRNIKVEKNWNLLGREKPVEKLEVELYRDGVATGDKLELNKDNNWSGEFKKLPVAEKLGSTTYYNYTVKEVGENAGSIIFGGMQFSVNYTGDMKDGFKITNNYTPPYTPWTPPTVDKIDLKVTKLWKDSKDNNIAEPTNKIVVELYREGKATGKRLELNKANKWSGEFTDLEAKSDSDEYYRYTIKEVGENGNIIKFDGKQYKVIYGGSMRDGITITNKKEDPPKPPTPNKPTPNKPTPNKPTPPKPNTPNPRPVLPRTGDGINPSTFAWLILALGACLSLVGYRLRKHAK